MADPFVAEIRIFPFNFPPRGWAWCDGQLLPISQNTALFSLLGTTYGGDGKTTFALPNLQGASPIFWGQGPGLTDRFIGEIGGSPSVTLLVSEMPAHTHQLRGTLDDADLAIPGPTRSLARATANVYLAANPNSLMAFEALTPAGGSLPHNNLQPYLTLYFNIALQGIFPPRG